MLEERC